MEDLRLVGTSDDGSRLVLQRSDGTTYALRVDERVHAALRGDRSRLGQLQIQLESELRPREIQARIRSGQTAEEIADASGVPVERIRRFEGPVLMERVHTVDLALGTHVRRVTDAAGAQLGALITERLREHGVDVDALEWDSWRREDARWAVRLTYHHDDRTHVATWLFDPAVRTIEPHDEEARWLTDEERAAPVHREQPPRAPRLAAVPSVAELRRPADAEAEVEAEVEPEAEPRVDLTTVTAVDDEDIEPEDFFAAVFAQTDAEPDPESEPAAPADGIFKRKPKGRHVRSGTRSERKTGDTDAAAERDGVRPGGRASVPTWDEILFGSGKTDDS